MEGLEQLLQNQNRLLEGILANQEKQAPLGGRLHTKAPANFSTYTPLHGPGGIWNEPGIERDVLTAYVRPMGLANELPLLPTVYTNPFFGILTGFTDGDFDAWPDSSCPDVGAGYIKGCLLTSQFGLLRVDSQTIDIDDVMLRLHRGDMNDLVLRGQLLGLAGTAPSMTNQSDVLNLVSASEMVQMGAFVERRISRALWQGNVASNQFPGLDSQIATGQVDAKLNTACPAADSDVKNFNYNEVGGTGLDIVEYLSMLEFYLRYNASQMGLDPVEWVIVMRPELWFELSATWPCAYNTSRCNTVSNNSRVFVDGRENVVERDSMRNGRYIDINGNRYRVVLDTGIHELTNVNDGNLLPGEYASSIYMVPLTVAGGMPVTYREYVDFRQAQADVNLTQGNLDVWWTDNGVFSWSLTQEKWCYKFHLKTEQRVVLRAPHLAGRIDAVKYTPLQHLREPYPDSPYYFDGGVSLRGTPTFNAVWNS